MNLKNNMFICLSIIIIGSVNGSINNTNQVDNDHRIRNFAFAGPYESGINMDSLSNIIIQNKFSYDTSLKIGAVENQWQAFTATGAKAEHNIWQVYPNIKLDESVIGSAKVYSDEKQEVILRIVAGNLISELWVNGTFSYSSNDAAYDKTI